jgi:hypothetical protein
MPIVYYSTEPKRRVLLQAVEFMVDFIGDEVAELSESLATTQPQAFDATVERIRALRLEQAFARNFAKAMKTALPGANAGVYLEPFEAGVVRDGLCRIEDIEENDTAMVFDILSEDNIKQVVLRTNTMWGAFDPTAFACELRKQVREVLDSKSAVRELLAELNAPQD